jgi:hypothetical protein
MATPKAEITGKLHVVGAMQQFAKLRKAQIVIDTGAQYGNLVPVDLNYEDADMTASMRPGMDIALTAYVGGREYAGRYYADLRAEKGSVRLTSAPAPVEARPAENEADKDDNMPF